MRKLLPALAFLALSVFWACHLNEGENEDHFDLIGDTSWVACDEVTVVLLDKDGKEIDVLFKGPLKSVADLKGLSAAKYDGTSAKIHISGTKAGAVCFDETRTFDGDGSNLKVDTLVSPTAKPTAVVVDPDSISIPLGGTGVAVKATVKPSYVDQGVEWRIAGDGVVSLTLPTGGDGSQAKINPAKIGSTEVLVISRKDSSKTGRLKVTVTAPNGFGVEIDQDSVVAYIGGGTEKLIAKVKPETADQKVLWSSLEPNVASIDTQGNVKGLREGETYLVARSVANNVYASTHVQVKRDAPKLTVSSKTGAPVNTPITFSPRSVQQYGVLVMFKWDLDGDGAYEDSTADSWPGKEVDLPPLTAKYAKEGQVIAKFLVRDGEGNESVAQVTLDIGNQAPEFISLSSDTSVSINDSVPFKAFVRDVDGKVAWMGWDYENDGRFDDSITPSADSVKSVFSHKYPDAGFYRAIIKAKDETGKARLDTVIVKVELDRPKALAGNDTTVTVGAKVPVHVGGTDKYGKIEKREVRLHGSSTGFQVLSKEDTVFTAPNEPGSYMVVARVTDDDGLQDVDTMFVTVVLSANADLSNLVFSAGALAPAFKPAISLYTAQVAYTDSIVTVTPTAKDLEAKVTVNAKPVASGSASDPVKLVVGSNSKIFEIIVTAPDGTQRTFTISVARDPSADASLAKLDVTGFALKPAFASTTLDYADTVSGSVATVTLKPTVAVPTATLTVNDSAMASGTATFPMPLAIGENVFKVVVTSQSGALKTTYTAKVIRRAQLILMRSLDGKPGTLIDSSESVPGAPQAISSDPVTGYHFVKWTLLEGTAVLKDSLANPTEITLKSAKVKAQANYVINQYVIKASGNAGGSIAPSGDVNVVHGSDQPFTIQALPGFRLRSLTVDGANGAGSMVGNIYTFKAVSTGHSITADFVKLDTLTAKQNKGGKISPDKIILDRGVDTAFTVVADPNYTLKSLLDNGVEKKGSLEGKGRYPIKADGDHSLEATWTLGVTMRGVAGVGGSITPDSVGVIVDAGSKVDFNVTVASGYRLDKLLDNGRDSTKAASFDGKIYTLANVDTSHTVVVTFKKQWNITVTPTGPGTVTGTPGLVDEGETRSYSLNYGKAVRVRSLKVDGAPSNLSIVEFKGITSDHSIEVDYVNIYFISTVWSAGGVNNAGGAISPANPTLDAGDSPTFTITPNLVTPNSGYRLDSTMVDGVKDASPRTSIPFTSLSAGHTVVAGFKRYFYIETSPATGGSIGPANAKIDTLGTQVISYTAAEGYRFLRLLDNGNPVSGATIPSYTLGAATGGIRSDHVMKAEFIKTYTVSETHTGVGKIDIPKPLVDADSSQVITIEPMSGYKLTQVKDNGELKVIQDPYKGTSFPINKISDNHVLEVTFTAYYALTATVNSANFGSVSPAAVTVDSGAIVLFTISPNANLVVKNVSDKTAGGVKDLFPILSFQVKAAEAHDFMVNFTEGATAPIAMAATSDVKGESVSANLCVMIGKERNCGATPYTVNVPAASIFNLFGEDGVIINAAGFSEDASVATWGQVFRLSEQEISKSNPTEEQKPEAGVTYRAHYIRGIFR